MPEVSVPEPEGQAEARTARYGTPSPRRRQALRFAIAVVGALLAAWLVWAAVAAATPDVRAQVIGFRVLDDRRVQVSVEVVSEPGVPVACTLRAQDRSHETTALTRVAVPAARTDRRLVRTVVETRTRAVVVTVVGCRRTS